MYHSDVDDDGWGRLYLCEAKGIKEYGNSRYFLFNFAVRLKLL